MTRVDFPTHEITVELGGMTISGWTTYEINTSLLEPVSRFHMTIPFEREVWDLCIPDSSIRVLIDSVVVLVGLVDERMVPEDGEVVEVLGRSMMGRLVDESCPSFSFEGLDLFSLIRKAADVDSATPKKYPWFKTVTFSNARNRAVLRGRGKKAKAAGEPIKITTQKKIGSRIEPGQTRWHVIENAIAQAGYIAFASGNGTELIVGKPNYDQEPQYQFFMPKSGSDRSAESTVLGMGIREALTDRYSRCICVGSGIGTEANYGSSVASRFAEARNNELDAEGVGAEFLVPKRLIIVRSVDSIDEARELARREMARRDAHGATVTVLSQGHGQVVAGREVTLFAPDTIATVEDERTGFNEECLIVSCTYRCDRENGEQTLMELVVSGAELTAA